MLRQKRKKNGQSVLEYATLIMFVLVAFLVFQKYIVRGFSGRWKGVGDSFGYGRLYDPNKTRECRLFNDEITWYNVSCYERDCDCHTILQNTETCQDCVISCSDSKCDDS